MEWAGLIPAAVIAYIGVGAIIGMARNSYAVENGASAAKAGAQGILTVPVWPVVVAVFLALIVVALFVTAFGKED